MTDQKMLRVLVVDDMVLYRKIVSDILNEMPNVEVVGTANNGKIALMRIAALKPDLITLDVEMPEMNGLEVLMQIKEQRLDAGVIVLSSFTRQGSEATVRALELGAFDFISKPQGGSVDENKKAVADELTPMVKAFVRRWEIMRLLKGRTGALSSLSSRTHIDAGERIQSARDFAPAVKAKVEIVAIGVSTGGPNALSQMLPRIPANIGVPILVVQHMPPMFTQSLAKSLAAKCGMEVAEATDGQLLVPNVILIAPGGKQMRVASMGNGRGVIIRLTDDPAENNCRPSADYLFRSIAYVFKERAVGVIMTGMGSDGSLGLKLMKRYGATIIAQDEETCVVYGMPKAAVDAGIVDVLAPLPDIAGEIHRAVHS